MNLILFERDEIDRPLARTDRRAIHVIDVLRRCLGESFDVGIVNGALGKARIQQICSDAVLLEFAWQSDPPPIDPIHLVVAMPRPQTARDILRDATSLGVASIHFVETEKSDPNYARSSLWTDGSWRRHLIIGAEQAFCTRLPEVFFNLTLQTSLAALSPGGLRLVLDNYESPVALSASPLSQTPVVVAIGPERGWSAIDRDQFRAAQFVFAHLGSRVLRTETACTVALAVIRAKLGLI